MNDEDKKYNSKIRNVHLRDLFLDPNNYRLINEPEYVEVAEAEIGDKLVQKRTFRLLAGERNRNVRDLIESFKANGYLPVDQIQVREMESGKYVVVEGNRRIAALKFLESAYADKVIDLGKLESAIFKRVPVVLYEDGDEMHYLTLMALKHISGNKKWAEWNQTKLLEKMHKAHGLEEDEICRRIGITKVELRRSLRALSFSRQYQESDYGDQFEESKFAMFREAVRTASLKAWLGWDDSTYTAENPENRELFFSWLSREPDEEQDEDGRIGFGEKYLEPALVKRDDIVLLGKIIDDEKALSQLKETRDINAAYRSSDLVFKERQEAAVKKLDGEIGTLAKMAIEGANLPELEAALGKLQTIVERTRAVGFAGVEQKTVFHDRIDTHFSELRIEKYRRLRDLELKRLSRINLIAGINNSGKTTLLEAIYLLCRQNDFTGLFEVMRRRGKTTQDRLNPEWFVEQLPDEILLSGSFDRMDSRVSIRHFPEETDTIDKSRYLESVEISSEYNGIKQESLTRIFKGRDRETQAGSMKLLCSSVFSSPFFLNEPHRYTSFYHKSTQSKALPRIIQFVREKIVPTVTDIRLVDKWQRFLVTDENSEYALDLTEYGEGMQRIFFISLLFASAGNGVILIDEFENAIHTELISNFAVFIHDLARMFNVQVFLTSQSKECIDAFVKKLPSADDFSASALVERDNEIEVREFSGTEFRKLVDAGNVDLRRAR